MCADDMLPNSPASANAGLTMDVGGGGTGGMSVCGASIGRLDCCAPVPPSVESALGDADVRLMRARLCMFELWSTL